ncbi:hypothetical protein Adu01nite_74970 [Paractinoplanes durhamensis]|uniref:Uncharacterized protein n=1 Tax=Paractinoplanes durhamensis TaxID=113563 RepID=A0ABQ3Z8K1_9ACTN|nr:hypothetical protein Adu01nite_74970 [Actinoplanes durhamensis]
MVTEHDIGARIKLGRRKIVHNPIPMRARRPEKPRLIRLHQNGVKPELNSKPKHDFSHRRLKHHNKPPRSASIHVPDCARSTQRPRAQRIP